MFLVVMKLDMLASNLTEKMALDGLERLKRTHVYTIRFVELNCMF